MTILERLQVILNNVEAIQANPNNNTQVLFSVVQIKGHVDWIMEELNQKNPNL